MRSGPISELRPRSENPDLVRAEEELRALQDQLTRLERGKGGHSPTDLALEKVPGVSLEHIRKLREVKYYEALFELWPSNTRQLELTRPEMLLLFKY
jgi:hypothetical protein